MWIGATFPSALRLLAIYQEQPEPVGRDGRAFFSQEPRIVPETKGDAPRHTWRYSVPS
jgi:hypothetical protein